ncbi:MAG: hypothetical protein WC917_04975 [Bacilli bacterium]|jgi:hypothetical protein
MTEDQIREIIEQIDPNGEINHGVLEDLIQQLTYSGISIQSTDKVKKVTTEEELRFELSLEEDWRKRAAIAAKIISLGLE